MYNDHNFSIISNSTSSTFSYRRMDKRPKVGKQHPEYQNMNFMEGINEPRYGYMWMHFQFLLFYKDHKQYNFHIVTALYSLYLLPQNAQQSMSYYMFQLCYEIFPKTRHNAAHTEKLYINIICRNMPP